MPKALAIKPTAGAFSKESAAHLVRARGRGNLQQGAGLRAARSVSPLGGVVDDPANLAGWATKRGLSASQALKGNGRYVGYVMCGRWLSDDRYGGLRNAAWMLRNSRVGLVNNPAALGLVIGEVECLVGAGDPLADVVEALAELLIHP